jgi:hypothetical protein
MTEGDAGDWARVLARSRQKGLASDYCVALESHGAENQVGETGKSARTGIAIALPIGALRF